MAEEKVYENWIGLARFTSVELAEMVLEGLHAKNIVAVLHSSAGHFGLTGQLGMSALRPIDGGYLTLMVPEEFIEDADEEGALILGEKWDKLKLVDIE